jgi:hypothetical protein
MYASATCSCSGRCRTGSGCARYGPRRPGRPDRARGAVLLLQHRRGHQRGLRDDREHGDRDGQPGRPDQARHGRRGPARASRCASTRRPARSSPGTRECSPATGTSPDATAEALDGDGWLHTGDVGEWVDGTHIKIVDRIKDIIITAGGKNISPSEIENSLKASPYIKEAVVIGDQRPTSPRSSASSSTPSALGAAQAHPVHHLPRPVGEARGARARAGASQSQRAVRPGRERSASSG